MRETNWAWRARCRTPAAQACDERDADFSGACMSCYSIIDAGMSRHVEHEIRIFRQRSVSKPWQVQFLGMARRTGGWVTTDPGVRLFECVDEAQRGLYRSFVEIVRDRAFHVGIGPLARPDGLCVHLRVVVFAALRVRPRNRANHAASAGGA